MLDRVFVWQSKGMRLFVSQGWIQNEGTVLPPLLTLHIKGVIIQ